jgi:hypothetical protein
MNTKWLLIQAFLNRIPCRVVTPGGEVLQFKVINRIEHEDGSTRSFNVEGFGMTGQPLKAHLRTDD